MRCCDVEALWDEMREGVEPRREHVLAHLRRCPTCQEMYREFEGVAYSLACLAAVEPPQSLVPRILDHIRALVKPGRRPADPDALSRLDSPIGVVFVAFRTSGITAIALDRGESRQVVAEALGRRLRRTLAFCDVVPGWVREALDRFFVTGTADLERIDVSGLTDFERAALYKAAQIPRGEVRSYGWVAREIGHPQAARAVGQVMARNPLPLLFPCHRVVDASGALHNYGYGLEMKARLLEMEGYEPRR
jgi:O-6-methylguanine DNA methyltransferase